jgi:hypothetical protein
MSRAIPLLPLCACMTFYEENFTFYHKDTMGSRGNSSCIPTSPLDGAEWSASVPGRITPREMA